jgi:hypothetical protein
LDEADDEENASSSDNNLTYTRSANAKPSGLNQIQGYEKFLGLLNEYCNKGCMAPIDGNKIAVGDKLYTQEEE